MKYAEAKFLSLYFISFKEVEKNVSLNIKFARLLKVTLQTWSAKKILSIRSEIIGEWCR